MPKFGRHNLAFIAVIPTLVVGTLASIQLARLDIERQATEERSAVVAELATVRARLEGLIESTFNATEGLVHLVGIQGGIDPQLYTDMARLAIGPNGHIRNISLAPGDVIAQVYPLAGNQKAVGFRYVDNPEQYLTVKQARDHRQPVLAGPVNLVQGGRGLINRSPVFTPASRDADGQPGYWGVISVVAHVDTLLRTAGTTSSSTLRIAVRGKDGRGKEGDLIDGDGAVFADRPVTMDVAVPDGSWQLGATPIDGWRRMPLHGSHYLRFGLAMTAILAFILGHLAYLNHQARRKNAMLRQEMRERQRAESELRLAATVFSSSAEGVVITDGDGNIVSTNRAFTEITGYTEAEVKGQNPRLLKSERHEPEFYQALWASLAQGGVWQGEIWNRRKNGEVYPEWLTISVIRHDDGRPRNYVAVFSDISSIKRSQAELEHLAHFDPLTDLPNRALFQDRLAHANERADRYHHAVALLLLDLDGFKTVNDSLGHPQGDLLLQQVAGRLRHCIRVEDTVARLGGDEFAIILSDLREGGDAIEVVRKVLDTVQHPFDLGGVSAMVTASVGIAIYPQDGANPTELVRNADAAMYGAKEGGRNSYRFYQTTMTERAQCRLQEEQALRQAIEQDEFEVWFQPKIDLASGGLLGAEALARWRHPQRGVVPPLEFIPLAERTGLIVPLGHRLLGQVCRQARLWQDAGIPYGKLSVNISARQIDRSDFVATLQSTLNQAGIGADCLAIEITDGFIMNNADHAREVLVALRHLGIDTAIDDFGTGYASLAHLKALPIDQIKIDRTFVRDIPEAADETTITRAGVALGHTLGYTVVAEGVEREAQRRFLREAGCDQAQGFLFAQPMPATEFEAWLTDYRPLAA